MSNERDNIHSASNLYRTLASKHELSFSEKLNADGDVFFVFPKQANLMFDMTLGLQNGDEANIGINDFWSYIFPYQDSVRFLQETIEGLVKGTHYLAEYRQFNRVTKLCLQNSCDEIIYTDIKRMKFPFFAQRITNITSNKKRAKL
jgi:hypothetical protein